MFEYNAKVLKIIDGDTLELEVDLGFSVKFNTKVRLSNVDTPEIYGVKKDSEEYQKGILASSFAKEFIESTNNNVSVKTFKDKKEKYGRYLVEIQALEGPNKNKILNEELLNSGNAVLFE